MLWQMREKYRAETRREQAAKRLNAGLVLGAGRCQLVRYTVLPSALPSP